MNEQAHGRDPSEIYDIDAMGLAQWTAQPEPLHIYDVRTQAEVAHGTIPSAVWLPLHLIPLEIDRLRTQAAAGRLVFYCQMGGRSAQACMYLARLGIGPVYNLRLGMAGWLGAGGQIKPLQATQA